MHVTDKTALSLGGQSLLERALGATVRARSVIVVGPPRDVGAARVHWVREDPPGGGPAAAVAAALDIVTSDVVVLLAADLPLVTTAHVERLVDAVTDDGAVYLDSAGVEQWLCSAWRSDSLRRTGLAPNQSLHAALSPLSFATLADGVAALDCDTPDDLRRAEELLT